MVVLTEDPQKLTMKSAADKKNKKKNKKRPLEKEVSNDQMETTEVDETTTTTTIGDKVDEEEEKVVGGDEAGKEDREEEEGEEPALKKPKINEAEEKVKEEMGELELFLGTEDKTLCEKSEALTNFFNSLVDNNVNTHLLKEDFPEWVKNWVFVVADGTTKVSDEFLKFLGSALTAAPTTFESILDKILSICFFYPRKKFTVEAYEDFMVRLVGVFERLRRFPKFIAKLLCCARDHLIKDAAKDGGKKETRKSVNKGASVDSKFLIEQILTPKLREAMGLIVNLLPIGQVVDLWKTLHHNLDVECIQRLPKSSGDRNLHTFFAIVTELFNEFLANAKVADYSVPSSTIDKVADLILTFRMDCLDKLAVAVKGRNMASEVVKSFLKLAYALVDLTGVMVWYNPQCKLQLLSSATALDDVDNTAATNLSMFHSYMDCDEWVSQCSLWLSRQEPELTFLVVKLISQKLKLLVAHQQVQLTYLENTKKEGVSEEHKDTDTENDIANLIKESADFIWTHQDFVKTAEMKDTLTLVADYVPSPRLMELASNLIKQLQINNQPNPDVPGADLKIIETHLATFDNSRLHYALVLEAFGEIMRRIGKMKLLSKFIKSVLNNTLCIENRAKLLSVPFNNRSKSSKFSEEYLKIAKSFSVEVNKLISEDTPAAEQVTKTEEFSGTLIDGMIAFVCGLDIENYPMEIKTIVFLCSLTMLFALSEQKTNNKVLNTTASVITSSCTDSQGNEILFGINWIHLFKWVDVSGLLSRLENQVQKQFCDAVLSNIYLSQKSASEFEENELKPLLSEEVTSDKLPRILFLLEFLIQESVDGKSVNKITPLIKQHATDLTNLVSKWLSSSGIKTLKKMTKSNQDITDSHCVILRALEIVGTAHQILQKAVDDNLKTVIITGVNVALQIASPEKITNLFKEDYTSAKLDSIRHALKFLHAVYTNKDNLWGDVKATMHSDLWKICSSADLWKLNTENHKSILPKRFVKDLLELSNPEDFQNICTSTSSTMKSVEKPEDTSRFMISYLMEEMLETELSVEKKPWRRKTVEEYLHSTISTLLMWDSSDSTVFKSIIPYIQFQIKLIRRRNAMIPLKSLAICLASVTSIPFEQIESIQVYRKVFCIAADLMNALVMHRVDVLSSRTHVYLQCFQYLVDTLAKKSDQKNKLSDGDIYDLRHCAHSIERMCQSIKTGQKEFSRISPYFVAVVMRQFEVHTVYPSIKNSLQNGVYKLLDMCDDNGVAQLNSMLTIGSREIFRTTYDLYKKYYKYRGRV